MRFLGAITATAAVLLGSAAASLQARDHDSNDYFALHLDPSTPPAQVARLLGAQHEGQIGELVNHHTFSVPKSRGVEADDILETLRSRRLRKRTNPETDTLTATDLDGIRWSQKLNQKRMLQKRIPPPPIGGWGDRLAAREDSAESETQAQTEGKIQLKEITDTLEINDPIFADQWHLFNSELKGNDLNVTGLWLEGITGEGAITAMVDDGIDMDSDDLRANYFAKGSYDFNEKVPEPKPRLFDDKHGTRCAGEIAAARNNACGVGVAYDSRISGIRILSAPVTDEDEAVAINYEFQNNQIYSCSWGPPDDGKTMEGPGILIRSAMVNGVQKGRDGRGSIFVFAAGNGAGSGDNCNFDGYTNSIYSVTVGSLTRENEHPYYSEACSAQLVVTYSSGGSDAIHTTDVGPNKCYGGHGGTSAAGPLVSGVVALALSVRPELSWRDIQYLLMDTAVPVNEDDGSWQETSIGKKFSHTYGYGKVDAYSMVKKAQDVTLLKPQAWIHSPWLKVHHEIPQGDKGLTSSFEITEDILKNNNFETLEHVTVTMNVNHTRRGDLSVELKSPAGVVSRLSTARPHDDEKAGYVDWTFMSVAHWGESAHGKWTVIVKDSKVNSYKGEFIDWRLNLFGEAIDGTDQPLHPLPEEGDHDHDMDASPDVATTTVNPDPTEPSDLPGEPSDHQHRPVKPKPTPPQDGPAAEGDVTATTGKPAAEEAASSTPTSDHFLPSPFPTFGVSKRTQIWIYAASSLIIVFFLALGVYFQTQRRKRIRTTAHDDYEFEMIADDDDEDGPGRGGEAGGKKHQRRGGELYDAFAGDSDDDVFSDDDEDGYHDHPSPEWKEKSSRSSDGSDGGG
ncbi:pheromone processing endoprotease [Arachnomyces sp. PD_36]|nr:pheromone processing endoprotease [Arachnomyces sp. PD_36]